MITTQEMLQVGSLTATLTFRGGELHAVDLPDDAPEDLDAVMLDELTARLRKLPLGAEQGTPFTRKVRERMQAIPAGSALTYAELAAEAGSPRAVRAVGQVCATNRLLLVVPCHRVVAQSGLGGFRLGLDWKRKLLELEAGG